MQTKSNVMLNAAVLSVSETTLNTPQCTPSHKIHHGDCLLLTTDFLNYFTGVTCVKFPTKAT